MTDTQRRMTQDFSDAVFGLQKLAGAAAGNPEIVRLLTPAPPRDNARFHPLQVMCDWDDGVTDYFSFIDKAGDILHDGMSLPAPKTAGNLVFARTGHHHALRVMGVFSLAARAIDRTLEPLFDIYWGLRHKSALIDPETRIENEGKRAAHAFFTHTRKRLRTGVPLGVVMNDLTGDVTGTYAAMEDFAFMLQPYYDSPRARFP